MKIISAVVFSITMSITAFASDTSGPVGTIWASPSSTFVMFTVTNPNTKYERCNESQRFSIDLRVLGGEATYQLLLLAKRESYRVKVESLNTCNPFDAENIRNLSIT